MLVGSNAFAGDPVVPTYDWVGSTSKTETKGYAGLNWNLEGGATPALVLGVFRTKTKLDGDTTGGNLAFHLNLAGGIKPGKLKLGYLNGQENVQGEAAIGFDFLKSAPLLSLGINAPYINAGLDISTKPSFVPYLTIHSQGKFDKPNRTCVDLYPEEGTYYDPACESTTQP